MKNGIEYFPLDCQLDDKLKLIEAEHGLKGFAIVVHLLQKIYGSEGYYCEWNDDVGLLFAKEYGVGYNLVSDILQTSIKRGIFSKEHFDKYGILTSRGIQKRYFEAVSRRKNVSVKSEYLLVDYTPKFINVDNSSENAYKNIQNVDISKQSKVKESKGKYNTASGKSKNNFHNFTQRTDVDYDKIEREALLRRINGDSTV